MNNHKTIKAWAEAKDVPIITNIEFTKIAKLGKLLR